MMFILFFVLLQLRHCCLTYEDCHLLSMSSPRKCGEFIFPVQILCLIYFTWSFILCCYLDFKSLLGMIYIGLVH